MKRFWKEASVVADGAEFQIQLDGKVLKLTSGRELRVPFFELAGAIAAEWDAIDGIFTPDHLPLTRLTNTAQDRVRHNRAELIGQLARFGTNDLLCYRASAQDELAKEEILAWDPWIEWAAKKLGIKLESTSGILPVDQSPECHSAFLCYLDRMSIYQIAGLGVIVPILGSLVLGLAVEADALSPKAASDCANLAELWQEARWGAHDDAAFRRKADAQDVAVSAQFMILCRA